LKLFTKYYFSLSASEFISGLRRMCKLLFSFIVYYRVLLLLLFMACQWHCPLPVISNKHDVAQVYVVMTLVCHYSLPKKNFLD